MITSIVIPSGIAVSLRQHLFQNDLEQGAFLFARLEEESETIRLVVEDSYLVPVEGWETQMDVYLQMKDSERAKIMQLARVKRLCAIDCHSHPHAGGDVWFSPSDVTGITEFSEYAKWKLSGRPFAAMVWAEKSIDAVLWAGEFTEARAVDSVEVLGNRSEILRPIGSWFRAPRGKHRFELYE